MQRWKPPLFYGAQARQLLIAPTAIASGAVGSLQQPFPLIEFAVTPTAERPTYNAWCCACLA